MQMSTIALDWLDITLILSTLSACAVVGWLAGCLIRSLDVAVSNRKSRLRDKTDVQHKQKVLRCDVSDRLVFDRDVEAGEAGCSELGHKHGSARVRQGEYNHAVIRTVETVTACPPRITRSPCRRMRTLAARTCTSK